MPSVTLRAMTVTEYDAWLPGAIEDYARHHVEAGSIPAEDAQAMAKKQFADLLPEGVSTPEHHVLVPEVASAAVGLLWLHIPTAEGSTAFVYDVVVDSARRGSGLGRAIMLAGEEYARARGATAMRLHVFGSNTVARHLYETLGYDVTNVMMSKSLASQ